MEFLIGMYVGACLLLLVWIVFGNHKPDSVWMREVEQDWAEQQERNRDVTTR